MDVSPGVAQQDPVFNARYARLDGSNVDNTGCCQTGSDARRETLLQYTLENVAKNAVKSDVLAEYTLV